jgi:sigma-B regulation protein RsbU (phosphoserine phosphatase)
MAPARRCRAAPHAPMITFLLILLVLLMAAAVFYLARLSQSQKRQLTDLRAEEEAIVAEERRLFGFLHDLGEAIWREDQQLAMHRLIVEGAMRVTQSTGGAIYTYDAPTKRLVPRHFSEFCAALHVVPDTVRQQSKDNPGAVLSFFRRADISPEEGVLGRIFTAQKSELVPDLGLESGATALVGPLSFGSRRLGILVLTAAKDTRRFNANDFEVFSSIAEQSAVALANALAQQEAARARADQREIDTASEIQKVLLPDRDPQIEGFAIAGKNIPARRLSGDYFDFMPLPDGRFGAVIADVSGKGMPAALITVMCRSLLRSAAPTGASPSAALGVVNRAIAPDIKEDMFITMTYFTLRPGTSSVTLARAGHNAALLWRCASGKIEAIHPPGLGVGIDTGAVFERVTKDTAFDMQAGDFLLLYTDGVNEAENGQGEEFGDERVQNALARLAIASSAAPRTIIDGILEEVTAFTGGKRSHDDITLIVLQKTV